MMKMDGLDDACVGSVDLLDGAHLVYSTQGILEILMKRDGMDAEEAIDFFCYNIERGVEYLPRDQRPLILVDHEPGESIDDFVDGITEGNY